MRNSLLTSLIVFISMCLCQECFSSTLHQEFKYQLDLGETSKAWEINIPLPIGEPGKFVGREFSYTVNTPDSEFIVEQEALTDQNYHAKGKLIEKKAAQNQSYHTATFRISLYTGSESFNDTPNVPVMVRLQYGSTIKVTWSESTINGKKPAASAKYLHYQLTDDAAGSLLEEQIVPLHLVGSNFQIRYPVRKNEKYILLFQVSGVSGKYSEPFKNYLPLPSRIVK